MNEPKRYAIDTAPRDGWVVYCDDPDYQEMQCKAKAFSKLRELLGRLLASGQLGAAHNEVARALETATHAQLQGGGTE